MAACVEYIDWSSFTFVAGTGQTLVSATELTATNGTAVFNAASRQIEYTVDTQNCNVDLIQYKVKDINGKWSNIASITFDYESVAAPVGVNNSVTVAAGESATVDAKANDGGDIDFGSYEIASFPTKAQVRNNGDGTFNVYAPDSTEGSDSFTYTYKNTNGIESAPVTVNITIQNAGTGTTSNICGVAGVNLEFFLTGSVTSGGSWAADPSNPSSPSIITPTSVDFSAASAGVYNFTYTIGDSSATITLTLPAYSVTIDSVSTPTNNPIAGSITSVVEFTTVGVSNVNNIELEVDVKGGTSFDYYPPAAWNPSTGKGTITIEYGDGAGTYDLTLSATDDCTDTQTDTWPTITITP